MAVQPAICSNCGGALKVNDADLNGFCECMFCHTPHRVIDVITIDGLPTAKTLLSNAEFYMDDRNFDSAVASFKEVIKIKPNCHEAWWGLYVCNNAFDTYYGYTDKYGNSGPITKASMMMDTLNKYAYRAIDFAPPNQADYYRSQIRDSEDYIDRVRSGELDKSQRGRKGCYIATAVYGDYGCNQVLALRRYRDDFLSHRLWGRLFIRFYYWISPALAKHIKPNSRIGKLIRAYLDRKVAQVSI